MPEYFVPGMVSKDIGNSTYCMYLGIRASKLQRICTYSHDAKNES